jgi:hypothetical protein
MATMKRCIKCREQKELTQFSKCSARKDGLQNNCKKCNSEDNLKFRTEINPYHHADWQHKNPQRLCELVSKYRKSDKGGKIYSIKNPAGEVYVGMTEAHLSVRKLEHRQHYKKAKKGKQAPLPLLHESFDLYGINNHIFETIVELGDIDRKQLGFIETSFIQSFKEIGKSLNVRIS